MKEREERGTITTLSNNIEILKNRLLLVVPQPPPPRYRWQSSLLVQLSSSCPLLWKSCIGQLHEQYVGVLGHWTIARQTTLHTPHRATMQKVLEPQRVVLVAEEDSAQVGGVVIGGRKLKTHNAVCFHFLCHKLSPFTELSGAVGQWVVMRESAFH
jgi:hypothetical protein